MAYHHLCRSRICLLVLGALVAGACGVRPGLTASDGDRGEVTLETVYESSHSGLTEEFTRAIREPDEADAFFRQLMAHRPEAAAAPDVDFSRWMLLAVGLGTRPNGGYSVEITRLEQTGDGWVAHYVTREPGPNCIVAQVITHPVHVVKVPRHTGEVRFHGTTVVDDCR